MWHNGGYACKDWVWNNIFWSPRIHIGQLIKINVPPQDTPNIETQKNAGEWDCYNTCDLEPGTEEPDLTTADLSTVEDCPEGHLYYKSQARGKTFWDS
jgi:hypothetical protein